MNLPQQFSLVTVIDYKGRSIDSSPAITGRKLLYLPGNRSSPLPFWLEDAAIAAARSAVADGRFGVHILTGPEERESATIMVDPYLPPPQLIILGAGHIAVPLAQLGLLLGYEVLVVDDRPDFAVPERFPAEVTVVCRPFNDMGNKLKLGPQTSVVVMTHGHQHDLICLRQLLPEPVAYLGVIGSRNKVELLKEHLLASGHNHEAINNMHMPVGLDIGAQTPAEIAVSIAAELVLTLRSGSAAPLKEKPATERLATKTSELPSELNRRILRLAIQYAHQGQGAAIATIIKAQGSTPRKAGARMLIRPDGSTLGTIGGGSAELNVIQTAVRVIETGIPALHQAELTSCSTAVESMVCGGKVTMFIEPVAPLAQLFPEGDIIES